MKLFLKGILLYTTILMIVLFICGIDSLYDNGYFGMSFVIICILLILCYLILDIKDITKLTFSKTEDFTDDIA